MSNRSRLTTFCLDWHVQGGSVTALVADPLSQYADVELVPWDETAPLRLREDAAEQSTLFFQLPPPRELILASAPRVVWMPMWDHARGLPSTFWAALPPGVRVVSLSSALTDALKGSPAIVYAARYFVDPALQEPASWNGPRTMYFWNRTGIIGAETLRRLCQELRVDVLLFRDRVDPHIPAEAWFDLPARLGRTRVEPVASFMPREAYLRLTARANILLAPRASEGVGIQNLEALARGCVVLAADSPTMNEYIVHRRNGYLLKTAAAIPRNAESPLRIRHRLLRFFMEPEAIDSYHRAIDNHQDWDTLSGLDLQAIGTQARNDHREGRHQWLAQLPSYAQFILRPQN